MTKSLFYRIFHPGYLPDEIKQRLTNDNIIYLEENISYSIIYRKYKSPNWNVHYKKRNGKASIGFSNNYFTAATQFNTFIDLPINHEKFGCLKFETENNLLRIKFNAGSFSDKRSGEVELTFTPANINAFHRFLGEK